MSPKTLDDIVKKLLVHDDGESTIVHIGKKLPAHLLSWDRKTLKFVSKSISDDSW